MKKELKDIKERENTLYIKGYNDGMETASRLIESLLKELEERKLSCPLKLNHKE